MESHDYSPDHPTCAVCRDEDIDPCDRCGSTDTGYEFSVGSFCRSCDVAGSHAGLEFVGRDGQRLDPQYMRPRF